MIQIPDDAWEHLPRIIAYDYGNTLASQGRTSRKGELVDNPVWTHAADTIRYLHSYGITAILSSNTTPTETREQALKDAGIRHCFVDLVLSSTIGYEKPDPRFYETLLERIRQNYPDIMPWQIWHVGDNLGNDAVSPVQHGTLGVWVTGSLTTVPFRLPPQVRTVRTVAELPPMLRLRALSCPTCRQPRMPPEQHTTPAE